MYELHIKDYQFIKRIVNDSYISVQLQSVIDGKNPGSVYADSMTSPTTALIFHQGEEGFYFVGNPHNISFHTEIVPFIKICLQKKLNMNNIHEFEFSGDSSEWNHEFKRIFHNIHLWESTQRIYLMKDSNALQKFSLPEGFHSKKIDLQFIQDRTIKNLSFIEEPVMQWWDSWNNFLKYGGGFAAMREYEIVGRCLIDGISQSRVAIGIKTDPTYQARGIASALASDMTLWIFKNNQIPYWECLESNALSIKLAEKCGFTLESTYQLFGFEL